MSVKVEHIVKVCDLMNVIKDVAMFNALTYHSMDWKPDYYLEELTSNEENFLKRVTELLNFERAYLFYVEIHNQMCNPEERIEKITTYKKITWICENLFKPIDKIERTYSLLV